MKPTSIIFLVVAALLLIAGAITCSVAKDIAETDGYALFDETANGEKYVQYDFTADGITKIDLVLQDAEVHIYGGAEKSYIEFYNFREGLYTFSTAGQILSLDEIPNIESLMDFSSGFSFGGMRYILRRTDTDSDGTRRVNVYLSAQTDTLKIIAIDAVNCTLTVDKLVNQCDITVTADESVTLTANELRTNCALTVTAEKDAAVNVYGAAVNSVTVSAGHGEISAKQTYFGTLDLTMDTGFADVTTSVPLDLCDYEIGGGSGTVLIGGTEISRPHEYLSEIPAGTIRFNSAEADLTVTALGE